MRQRPRPHTAKRRERLFCATARAASRCGAVRNTHAAALRGSGRDALCLFVVRKARRRAARPDEKPVLCLNSATRCGVTAGGSAAAQARRKLLRQPYHTRSQGAAASNPRHTPRGVDQGVGAHPKRQSPAASTDGAVARCDRTCMMPTRYVFSAFFFSRSEMRLGSSDLVLNRPRASPMAFFFFTSCTTSSSCNSCVSPQRCG